MNQLLIIVDEIKRLENTKDEPFKKVKLKILRNKLLENISDRPKKVGNYILKKSYQNRDPKKPYVQIYTTGSWKRHEAYSDWEKYKKYLNKKFKEQDNLKFLK